MVSPRHWSAAVAVVAMACLLQLAPAGPAEAADHGESPLVTHDQGSDIADVFLFLDPNDNSKVIIAVDTHGFIVPAENANLGHFDPSIRYRFQIENTGDARGDAFVDVTFSPQTSRTAAQTATIVLPSGASFTAPTTVSSATADTAPPPTITTDAASGVAFFAGLTDDPFFFDIPAELRYRASRVAGTPNPAFLTRGRDSFAGYNVTMIALSVPVALLRGSAGNVVGLTAFTQRNKKTTRLGDGTFKHKGAFVSIDRMGIPAVNTVFVPFARKDEYNQSTTVDDSDGRFANDIVATLTSLLTDQTSIGILASVAVTNGDILRLDTSVANTGGSGGTNAEASFPNGRRPADDVIDIIVTLVNNRVAQGDDVDGNDVPFRSTFPFFAPPHQPFASGTVDDRTRN
jgi:hypothetical protein